MTILHDRAERLIEEGEYRGIRVFPAQNDTHRGLHLALSTEEPNSVSVTGVHDGLVRCCYSVDVDQERPFWTWWQHFSAWTKFWMAMNGAVGQLKELERKPI